jgi:hypothetical protein
MSVKSNQGSLNTSLGKLTVNNAYDANTNTTANPFVAEQTIITPTFISVNGNVVSTAKILSTQFTGINVNVPAEDVDGNPGTITFLIDGDALQYSFTALTVPTWSFTTVHSSITVSDIEFNVANNDCTITFSNDVDVIGIVESLYINFYTPPY